MMKISGYRYMTACLCLAFALSGCGNADVQTDTLEQRISAAESTEAGEDKTSIEQEENMEEDLSSQKVSSDFFAMDTYMVLTAYGANAKEALNKAEEEILRLDSLLSTGEETSEVSRLNQGGGGAVSEDVAYLLERSIELYNATGGVFNIAVYPVKQEWGFPTGDYQVPSEERLQELLQYIDLSDMQYDAKESAVTFGNDQMQIDLGGIAKGYASARAREIFIECGVTDGIINLGGNVQTVGAKPDQSGWKVAIQSPAEDGSYIGVLTVKDCAVITSGGYERYFEQDGIKYHHIIDPATGYPSDSGLSSVTIVSTDATLADGLSTALFVMGREEAAAYWRENSELFDAILLEEDGSLYVTEGIAELFTSDLEFQIIEKEGA